MIKDTNKQIGIVIDEDNQKRLDVLCKTNGLSKSVVFGFALAALYEVSKKAGYKLGDMAIKLANVENQPNTRRSKPSEADFEYFGSLEDV